MPETREHIIERMAKVIGDVQAVRFVSPLHRELAESVLPIAVKVVTERVREMAHIEDWPHSRHSPNEGEPECPGCWAADIHQVCDQIDAELGGLPTPEVPNVGGEQHG